jgi:hypothetical protein
LLLNRGAVLIALTAAFTAFLGAAALGGGAFFTAFLEVFFFRAMVLFLGYMVRMKRQVTSFEERVKYHDVVKKTSQLHSLHFYDPLSLCLNISLTCCLNNALPLCLNALLPLRLNASLPF